MLRSSSVKLAGKENDVIDIPGMYPVCLAFNLALQADGWTDGQTEDGQTDKHTDG